MENLLVPNSFFRNEMVSNGIYTTDLTKIKQFRLGAWPLQLFSDFKTSWKSSISTPAISPLVVYIGERNLISSNVGTVVHNISVWRSRW